MMISAGELVDMRGILDQDTDLTRQQQSDLIEECHRQRHLIEEMADFRNSQEHDKMMAALKEINRKLTSARKQTTKKGKSEC